MSALQTGKQKKSTAGQIVQYTLVVLLCLFLVFIMLVALIIPYININH